MLEQRIGRIYRLGQKLPIDVYNLVSEHGIESRIAALVGSKQAFFKGLFDGESDSVQFDQSASFLAKVQKLYDIGAGQETASNGSDADDDLDPNDTNLDESDADPFDDLIEAADELRDQAVAPEVAAPNTAVTGPVAVTVPIMSKNPDLADSAFAAMPSASQVREFFSQLKISRATGGNVVIEATEESASTLARCFRVWRNCCMRSPGIRNDASAERQGRS